MIARVGIDACSLGPHRTGVGNYIFPILDQLCVDHPETTFYLYSNTDIAAPEHSNVVVRRMFPKRRGPIWQNTHLRQMANADEVQVLWATNGYLPLIGMRRIATVLTIHDLVYHFVPETSTTPVRWARRLFQGRCARSADKVITVSAATACDVEKVLKAPVRDVVHPVIYPAFQLQDERVIKKVLAKQGLTTPYLLCVGTLEPRKNVVSLISSYLALRNSGELLPNLVLVGGQGWLNEEIEREISAAEKSGWIRRLGYIPFDDLPALYAGCFAFLMPSYYEGFGIPVQEAQKCGAPVLHGNHASMVEAGGSLGIAFSPDPIGITDALRALARQESPLVCRVPDDIKQTASTAANAMWAIFREAYAQKADRSR